MYTHKIANIRTQIYQILKDEICNGVFPSGYRLQETELASRYAVSRSPVREALRLLAAEGLVEEEPNRGTFVRALTRRDIEEIYELRVLLERYAIDILSASITQEGADTLLAILSDLELAYGRRDLKGYIQLDSQLHGQLITLCGNSLLTELYSRLANQITRFRHNSLTSEDRFRESVDEHRELVHCVVSGKAEEAKRINGIHLTLAKEKVVEQLERTEAGRS